MMRNRELSWYRVIFAQGSFVNPESIYQSPDFPHVFLGAAEEDDIRSVEEKAGKPVCIRIDLRGFGVDERTFSEDVPSPQMRVPLPDDPTKTPDMKEWQTKFNQTVDQLASIISSNQCPIYVHCSAGMNRSVATLGAALSKLTGRDFQDILSEMKMLRPMINPNTTYQAWGEQATQENLPREVV